MSISSPVIHSLIFSPILNPTIAATIAPTIVVPIVAPRDAAPISPIFTPAMISVRLVFIRSGTDENAPPSPDRILFPNGNIYLDPNLRRKPPNISSVPMRSSVAFSQDQPFFLMSLIAVITFVIPSIIRKIPAPFLPNIANIPANASAVPPRFTSRFSQFMPLFHISM